MMGEFIRFSIFVSSITLIVQSCVPVCYRDIEAIGTNEDGTIINYAYQYGFSAWTLEDQPGTDGFTECDLIYGTGHKPGSLNSSYGGVTRDMKHFHPVFHMMNDLAREYVQNHDDNVNILSIGHGIGILPKMQRESLPNAHIVSVDIDANIFTVAANWFCNDFSDDAKVELIADDGIAVLQRLLNATESGESMQYDIIHVDAFIGDVIVPAFTTKDFYKMIRQIWSRWDDERGSHPRLFIQNILLDGSDASDNAIAVFGTAAVRKHFALNTILSIVHNASDEQKKAIDAIGNLVPIIFIYT